MVLKNKILFCIVQGFVYIFPLFLFLFYFARIFPSLFVLENGWNRGNQFCLIKRRRFVATFAIYFNGLDS